MDLEHVIGIATVAVLILYLGYVLIWPERF